MADRCTGHCCQHFYVSTDVHRDGFDPILNEKLRARAGMDPISFVKAQIAGMIVMDPDQPTLEGTDPGIRFSCKHYDREGHQCRIYDSRPQMCRGYGVTYPCQHKACQWDQALHVDGRGGQKQKAADPED